LSVPDYAGAATTPGEYLRESIVDHCTDLVPGYSCDDVPNYGLWMSTDEATRIAAYVEALR
jgi:hypothetical protein